MNYQRILIEVLIILCYWFVEKLFSLVFINLKLGKQGRIHHPIVWTILLFALTWWNLGYYYIAYPLILIALLGIGLVIKQLISNHEFLYRPFWQQFWILGVGLMIISYVVSIFCCHLPTP
ncbi:MAG: hypothetical protein SO061_00195 [Limosilactobacillus coleohominis]|nr:hypothetical protein [Limosilactobacillus coleohominis]MDY3701971.1 hypothetical protein [Limosilactobacillus coleohominis]